MLVNQVQLLLTVDPGNSWSNSYAGANTGINCWGHPLTVNCCSPRVSVQTTLNQPGEPSPTLGSVISREPCNDGVVFSGGKTTCRHSVGEGYRRWGVDTVPASGRNTVMQTKTQTNAMGETRHMSGKSGAPLANKNSIKHGLYATKPRDSIKSQRIRRRVARRLAGIPPELKAVMRPVTKALCEVEDRLETMRDFLDKEGLTNGQGEPRRMVSEYRHYWKLWLEMSAANGMTLASYMATRKDALHGNAVALRNWIEGE